MASLLKYIFIFKIFIVTDSEVLRDGQYFIYMTFSNDGQYASSIFDSLQQFKAAGVQKKSTFTLNESVDSRDDKLKIEIIEIIH